MILTAAQQAELATTVRHIKGTGASHDSWVRLAKDSGLSLATWRKLTSPVTDEDKRIRYNRSVLERAARALGLQSDQLIPPSLR